MSKVENKPKKKSTKVSGFTFKDLLSESDVRKLSKLSKKP